MAENLTFRYAERKDTQLILLFILELTLQQIVCILDTFHRF